MEILSEIETMTAAGGLTGEDWRELSISSNIFNDWGGGFSDFADQRNNEQREMDRRAKEQKEACSWLNNSACKTGVDLVNYKIQSDNYAICMAEGGIAGPDGCGQMPVPPKR